MATSGAGEDRGGLGRQPLRSVGARLTMTAAWCSPLLSTSERSPTHVSLVSATRTVLLGRRVRLRFASARKRRCSLSAAHRVRAHVARLRNFCSISRALRVRTTFTRFVAQFRITCCSLRILRCNRVTALTTTNGYGAPVVAACIMSSL